MGARLRGPGRSRGASGHSVGGARGSELSGLLTCGAASDDLLRRLVPEFPRFRRHGRVEGKRRQSRVKSAPRRRGWRRRKRKEEQRFSGAVTPKTGEPGAPPLTRER